jgi:hypothetical protein
MLPDDTLAPSADDTVTEAHMAATLLLLLLLPLPAA